MGASDFSKLPHIGESLKRKEDYRFLTGAGQYTDDVVLAAQSHAVFVRSPHAHAKINSINIDAAKAAPGVLGVFIGADVAADNINGLPCGWLITSTNGEPMKEPPHPILAQGKVRYVGDHVAMVVALTQQQARDAAELVEVDYDVLPAVVNVADAASGAVAGAAVHDIAPDNHCFKWAIGDKGGVDAAFANAAHVTQLDLINNRLIPNAMEPRAAIGSYNRASDEYTLYVSNQNPHVERLLMTAFVMGLPEHKVRVIAPDVGGGFGSKIYLYAEDVCLTWAAKKLNRNIKWVADRSEAFLSDAHGRDHVSHAEMAMDKDGKFLAMRVHTHANLGAYLSTFASAVPTILYATLLAGQYTTPQVYVEVDSWFTNTAQWTPTGARVGLRPPTCWSGWSPAARGRWDCRRTKSAAATSSRPSRTRRRWLCSTTPATSTPAWTGRTNSPTWQALSSARPPARPRACCGASATRRTLRPVALRRPTSRAPWARGRACLNAARCACTPPAA